MNSRTLKGWRTRVQAAVAAGVVCMAAMGLGGCQRKVETEAPAPAYTVQGESVEFTAPPRGLRTIPTEDAGIVALNLPGHIAWDEDRTVRVFSPFGGRVLRVLVHAGESVRRDQPLAEIASPDYDQAQADAHRAASALTLASQARSRARELNTAGVVAQKDVEQSEADYAAASAEHVRAQNRLAQVGAGGAQVFLLKAPIAGVVVEKNINPGQEIRTDQGGAPFFVVTDPSHLWVWIDAPESSIHVLSDFRPGVTFTVSSAAYPGKQFNATLEHSVDFVDSTTRTFRLRGAVDNPDRLLKGEMYVNVQLASPGGPSGEPQRTLDPQAVLMTGGRQYVFVQDSDRRFTRMEVRVVSEQVGRTTVAGLPEGREVVTEGNLFLAQLFERQAPEAAKGDAPAAAGGKDASRP